jgi:hypothetical protein
MRTSREISEISVAVPPSIQWAQAAAGSAHGRNADETVAQLVSHLGPGHRLAGRGVTGLASVERMTWLGALWWLVSVLTDAGPSALAGVLVVAALAAVVLLLVRAVAGDDPATTGLALRRRSDKTGVPRYRDPDAPGRTRPRGPTARPLAAAL